MGQDKPVHIIYPLFDETLDVLMFQSLQRKMKIITQVMGDSTEVDDTSVGREVIGNLMKH
jgi:SNF2 family DNA or RNA helicase